MLKSVNKLYYTCMFIHIHSQLCKQTALYILPVHINTCTLSILHINNKNQQFYNNNNRFYSTQSTKINKNLKI